MFKGHKGEGTVWRGKTDFFVLQNFPRSSLNAWNHKYKLVGQIKAGIGPFAAVLGHCPKIRRGGGCFTKKKTICIYSCCMSAFWNNFQVLKIICTKNHQQCQLCTIILVYLTVCLKESPLCYSNKTPRTVSWVQCDQRQCGFRCCIVLLLKATYFLFFVSQGKERRRNGSQTILVFVQRAGVWPGGSTERQRDLRSGGGG